jgi:hypothetical protein
MPPRGRGGRGRARGGANGTAWAAASRLPSIQVTEHHGGHRKVQRTYVHAAQPPPPPPPLPAPLATLPEDDGDMAFEDVFSFGVAAPSAPKPKPKAKRKTASVSAHYDLRILLNAFQNYMKFFLDHRRIEYLLELIRYHGWRGQTVGSSCPSCISRGIFVPGPPPLFRCRNCPQSRIVCQNCLVSQHVDNPYHRVTVSRCSHVYSSFGLIRFDRSGMEICSSLHHLLRLAW